MSGGSYDYAYSKIDELERWASVLESMAERCEAWGVQGFTIFDPTRRAATEIERSMVAYKGARLRQVAYEVREAARRVRDLEDLMQAVEWAASGDSGPDSLLDPDTRRVIALIEKVTP